MDTFTKQKFEAQRQISSVQISIIGFFVLALGWSIWAWSFYPIRSLKPEVKIETKIKTKTITKIKLPEPPMDVLFLGEHRIEAEANCKFEGGMWEDFWYNWQENRFWPICYYNGTYYKVYVPEKEKPEPCLTPCDFSITKAELDEIFKDK